MTALSSGTRHPGPHRASGQLPRLVPGTLVVSFLLATGRWGSYVGFPAQQIYLTDVLLVATTIWTIARYRTAIRAALGTGLVARSRKLAPVVALSTWAVVRATTGITSPEGLRDLAPYVYLSVAVLLLVPFRETAGRRTLRVLAAALLAHAAWLTLSLVVPSATERLPLLGGRVRVFELRADYDGATMAVLAGLALFVALVHPGRLSRLICLAVAAWASALVLLLANRASLIALLLAVSVATVSSAPSLRRAWVRYRRWVLATGAVLVVAALVLVPHTPTYQRLTGDSRFAGASASGTASARQEAWTDVVDYVDSRPARVAVGVGVGPDFLKASGAAQHYQAPGEPVVRQPHNFALNTYARLGVIGVLILGWLLVSLGMAMWRTVRRLSGGRAPGPLGAPLEIVSVVLCISLLVTAMLGVILEAPFGALPFGWASGLILLRGSTRAVHEEPR